MCNGRDSTKTEIDSVWTQVQMDPLEKSSIYREQLGKPKLTKFEKSCKEEPVGRFAHAINQRLDAATREGATDKIGAHNNLPPT
jgi:hypothetical protein